ncbi:hypothetical protein NUACC26_006880 [Scytonema sp. NUACC26]
MLKDQKCLNGMMYEPINQITKMPRKPNPSRKSGKEGYTQVSGYISEPLATKFKGYCKLSRKEISEILEELIDRWVTQYEENNDRED